MEEIIDILHKGNYSCVIKNKDGIFTFSQRGILDLYNLTTTRPGFLNNALVADKVIGKAAAALMILGGVKEIYADVISLSAYALLNEARVKVDHVNSVPYILNRDKTDMCPMEKKCSQEMKAENIFPLIEEFVAAMERR